MKRLPIWIITTVVAMAFGIFMGNGGVAFNIGWNVGEFRMSGEGTANFLLIINDIRSVIGAKSSIMGIALGIAYWVFATYLPRKNVKTNTELTVGVFRRIAAAVIDAMVVTVIALPLVVLPILFIENVHADVFSWEFIREYSSEVDAYKGWLVMILFLAAMAGYYLHCLVTDRATLGQYSMGYRIATVQGDWNNKAALKRVGLTMLAFWVWPVIAIMAGRDEKKAFLYDSKTNSFAERFDYVIEE